MINEFKNILENLPKKLVEDNNIEYDLNWTLEIKKQFYELGKNKDYHVCTTKSDSITPHSGEWLYDLCWIIFNNDKNEYNYGYLKDIVLALECEWGNSDKIIDDFHKLLQTKAKYKIMIFQSTKPEKLFEYMNKNINDYWKTNDENYLLACYDRNVNNFKFRII
ncbi:MAG: hypothetical protein JXB88_01865 [Spirochaetales bacterium]|nr:hypothetical protein [Spirochaetales bacterium]